MLKGAKRAQQSDKVIQYPYFTVAVFYVRGFINLLHVFVHESVVDIKLLHLIKFLLQTNFFWFELIFYKQSRLLVVWVQNCRIRAQRKSIYLMSDSPLKYGFTLSWGLSSKRFNQWYFKLIKKTRLFNVEITLNAFFLSFYQEELCSWSPFNFPLFYSKTFGLIATGAVRA